MDDQTTKIVVQTIANLTEVAARNTIGAVSDKVKSAKAGRDKDKTIAELEDLINQIVNDKIELERIAKTLENELVSQQISAEDINFIVKSVIPVAEGFIEDKPKDQEKLEAVKSLLSKEILQVMQLIGFNYRQAIGQPLTELCAKTITNLAGTEDQTVLAKLSKENEIKLIELAQNIEAYNRFARMIGRTELIVEKGLTDTDG